MIGPVSWLRKAARRLRWAHKTWAAAREVAVEQGLGTIGVLREQVRLHRRHNLNQFSYYWYRLYEPSIAPEQKARYLPDSGKANNRLWALLTPPAYRVLYDNKLLFNYFFGGLGFPLARVLGVYDPQVGFTAEGASLRTVHDLKEWLRRRGSHGFVFKPVEGIQGHHILVFVGAAPDDPAIALTLSGERYDAESLNDFTRSTAKLEQHNPGANLTAFLLEERIRPHSRLAEFVGPTLCSVRMQTIIARDGNPQIIAAVFKLQPGNVGVDQLLHGAVGCWVELDSGRLGRGRSRKTREDATLIPGTERPFAGFELPDWGAAKDLALRAAAAFPWARSIGWDIGLSDRGPVLLEGNERWSPSLIQMPAPRGLMEGEFKALCDSLELDRRPQGRA